MNFKNLIETLIGKKLLVNHNSGYYQLSVKDGIEPTLMEISEDCLVFNDSLSEVTFYIPLDKVNKVTLPNPKLKRPKPSFEQYKEGVLNGLRAQRAWSQPTDEQLKEMYNNLK